MQETWKPVLGYEGHYEVSDLGRVRSTDTRINLASGRTRVRKGRVLAEQWTNRRYASISLARDGETNGARVHRLAAVAFVENPNSADEVNHIDGDRRNNAASNLEWVTRAQNNDHAISSGLKIAVKGVAHGMARLSEETVLAIRAKHSQGTSMYRLAKNYGVSIQTISAIVNRRSWSHI